MSTVRITFKGTAPVLVPDAGLAFVQPGETVSIDTELAAKLQAQSPEDWVRADKKAAERSDK